MRTRWGQGQGQGKSRGGWCWVGFECDSQSHMGGRNQPDMRPVDLPPGTSHTDPNTDGNVGERDWSTRPALFLRFKLSSDESYRTAETGDSGSGAGSGKGKRRDSSPPTHHPYVGAGEVQTAHQVYFIPSLTPSHASSIFVQDPVIGRSGVPGRHETGSDSSE
jgi:hypothetical protein